MHRERYADLPFPPLAESLRTGGDKGTTACKRERNIHLREINNYLRQINNYLKEINNYLKEINIYLKEIRKYP